MTPKEWTDRDGIAHPALDLVAHAALTATTSKRNGRRSSAPQTR